MLKSRRAVGVRDNYSDGLSGEREKENAFKDEESRSLQIQSGLSWRNVALLGTVFLVLWTMLSFVQAPGSKTPSIVSVEISRTEIGSTSMENDDENIADPQEPEQVEQVVEGEEEGEEEEEEENETKEEKGKTTICVRGTNPRVASLFLRNYLGEFGSQFVYTFGPTLVANVDKFKGSGSVKTNDLMISKRCTEKMPVVQLLTRKAFVAAPPAGPRVTRIIVGDEFCNCGFACTSHSNKRQVMRQYFSNKYPEDDYLPLGPRFEFVPVRHEERSNSERSLIFNFIGAMTSNSRKELGKIVSEIKVEKFVHLIPAWQPDAANQNYLDPQKYREILLNSQFTLCPAGHNPEAFRTYEAIDSGSIPIIVLDKEYQEHNCDNALQPLLDSNAPFIVLQSWDQLSAALQPFIENKNLVEKKQAQLLEWRQRFWTKIAKRFDQAVLENTAKVPQALQADGKRYRKMVPLITGCGRSGTHSLMKYLVTVGIPAVHEKTTPGKVSVSWLYAAKLKAGETVPWEQITSNLNREKIAQALDVPPSDIYGPVVHLVRHPLKVMSSTRRCFCGMGNSERQLGQRADYKSWRFAEQHIPLDTTLPDRSLERSAVYWLEWNKLIQHNYPNATRLRLEDLDPKEIFEGLGLQPKGKLPSRVPRTKFHTSPDKEKQKTPDVTWKELYLANADLAQNVFGLAQQYGYEQGKILQDLL